MDLSHKRAVILRLHNRAQRHKVVLAEDKDCISLQPKTRWLFRTEVNNTVTVELLVTQFGRIPAKSPLDVYIENKKGGKPELKYDKGPLNFKDGIYKISITPDQNPDHIRKYVDGQVYQLQYGRYDDIKDLVDYSNIAQVSAIHVLVWDVFTKPEKTSWYKDISPIFQQYADLYPVMKINFFDLGNYYDVVNNKDAILRTMKLDPRDPNFMPVTRDLSPNKTEMITKWLSQDIPYHGAGEDLRINIKTLRYLLQIALQIEHATIPPYLNGFFSIKCGHNQEVKEILYNIFKDEMHHLAQVSNLLNAFGGHPDVLDQHFVLPYPSHLPGGVNPGVKISINKVSYQQIHDVYMEIEKPSNETEEFGMAKVIDLLENISAGNILKGISDFWNERASHVESVNHNTIGEFYMAIICVIDTIGKEQINNLIEKSRTTPQLKRGPVIEVTNFTTAIKAIKLIVEQGEGASGCNPLYSEKKKSISHYFQFASIIRKRLVKSYPYNATEPKHEDQKEPSSFHLYKEQKCNGSYDYVGKTIPFYKGGVWPLVDDPEMSKYTNPRAINLAQSFRETYHNLLRTLQSVFNGEVHRFDDTFGLMKALVIIANRLVQTPIHEDGDPEIGPNAAPIYN